MQYLISSAAKIALAAALVFHSPLAFSQTSDEKWAEVQSSLQTNDGYFATLYKLAKFYFGNLRKTHTVGERSSDIKSDLDYISERRYQNSFGNVSSFYDNELQTRIYHSVTAPVDESGKVPVVDRNSKGLFVYFHGSGTENGSGSNFNYKGNRLSVLGYSSLSFDYPFHGDGPIDSSFGNAGNFMEYINTLINKYRVPGQPVYLVGHSFGVNVIAEYISVYPYSVDGAVLLSPAGFTRTLARWAKEKTVPMLRTFPHFSYNEMGARWAAYINRSFQWQKWGKKRSYEDPTKTNPELRVRVVSGEYEEFIPGPLDEKGLPEKAPRTYKVLRVMKLLFSKAEVTLEPKVGHLVQSHTDSDGHDLVLRELLKVAGENISDSKTISGQTKKKREATLSEFDLAVHKTVLDPFFKGWLGKTYGENYFQSIRTDSERTRLVRKVLGDYKKFDSWRQDLVLKNVIQAKTQFFKDNEAALLDQQRTGNVNQREQLVGNYFRSLSENPKSSEGTFLQEDPYQKWIEETQWNRSSPSAPAAQSCKVALAG